MAVPKKYTCVYVHVISHGYKVFMDTCTCTWTRVQFKRDNAYMYSQRNDKIHDTFFYEQCADFA